MGGAVAASTAQAIATPLDVARVRIMTSDATDVVGTMKDIANPSLTSLSYCMPLSLTLILTLTTLTRWAR